MRPVATCLILSALITTGVSASTIRVPLDQPTIQAGINVAAHGDTVLVEPGTYQESLDFSARNILVKGRAGCDSTFLSAAAHITNLVLLVSGEDTTATLDGFSVVGISHQDALIRVNSGGTIRNCKFIGNSGVDWGVIGAQSGTVRIIGCTFVDNVGGTACVASQASAMTVSGNWFAGNRNTFPYGGAVGFGIGGVALIESNVFWGNSGANGGAIFLSELSAVVTGNTMVMDTASANNGGGLCVWYYCPGITVTKNLIVSCEGYGVGNLYGSTITLNKNNLWSNAPGDYVGNATPGPDGFSSDPMFVGDSFYLHPLSPCLPQNNAFGDLVGARGLFSQPTVDSMLIEGTAPGFHLIHHAPLIEWFYQNLSGIPQDSAWIQVGTDSIWTNGAEMLDTMISGTQQSITYDGLVLEDGARYWLRVSVFDGYIWSIWNQVEFGMNSQPPQPTLLTPTSDQEVSSSTPTCSAVVGADAESDSQQLVFQVVWPFETVIAESPPVPLVPASAGDTVQWTVDTVLTENFRYWWRVQPWDGYEWGYFGHLEGDGFVVNAIEEPPQTPLLLMPAAPSLYTQYPTMVWRRSQDPDQFDTVHYELQVAQDSGFVVGAEIDSLSDTSHTVTFPLDVQRQYWWKVLARDNHGLSAESEVLSFTTYTPGDANGSGLKTSADVITLVGYVFKGQELTVPECVGNVDGDGDVDSADIIWLVNTIFKGGVDPIPGCG